MAYEQKPNSGSLFPNDRKEKETHPDLTGTVEIDGRLWWISAWERQTKTDGRLWLSLSFRPKEAEGSAARPVASASKWARPVQPPANQIATTYNRPEPTEAKQANLDGTTTDDAAADVPF